MTTTCPHCCETIEYGSETCQVTSEYGGEPLTQIMHYGGCAEEYERSSRIVWPNGDVTEPVD